MLSPRQAMTPSMNTQRVYTWEGICWGAVIVNCSSVLLTSVDIKGKPIWHNRGNGIVDFGWLRSTEDMGSILAQ